MIYFILNNTNFEIVAECEDNSADQKILNSVMASLPDDAAYTVLDRLPLPAAWYGRERPDFITLSGVDRFVCTPGCFPDARYIAARISLADDTTLKYQFHVVKPKHIRVTTTSGDAMELSSDSMGEFAVSYVNTEDASDVEGALSYSFAGDEAVHTVEMISGVSAPLTIPVSSFCNHLLRAEIDMDHLFKIVSLDFGKDTALVTTSILCSVATDSVMRTVHHYMVFLKGRRGRLIATDELVLRHRDQVAWEGVPVLSDEQYLALLAYRQALRDMSTTLDLNNIVWPPKPAFIL